MRSTQYIIGFAAAVCLVCGVVVAGSYESLKERQEINAQLDKKKKVLGVVSLYTAGEDITPEEIDKRFADNIQAKLVDLSTGQYADASEEEIAAFDQRKARQDPARSKAADANPAQVARVPNQALVYLKVENGEIDQLVLPIEGKGLWSTLYGFLALEADAQTVAGIVFYEHAETPGLGGEVDNPRWRSVWKGRKVYGDDGAPEISVIKGPAGPASSDPYHIDGLSGATITSRGVSYLVQFWMGQDGFKPYIERFRAQEGA